MAAKECATWGLHCIIIIIIIITTTTTIIIMIIYHLQSIL